MATPKHKYAGSISKFKNFTINENPPSLINQEYFVHHQRSISCQSTSHKISESSSSDFSENTHEKHSNFEIHGHLHKTSGISEDVVQKLQETNLNGVNASLPPEINYIDLSSKQELTQDDIFARKFKKNFSNIHLIPNSIRKIAGIRKLSKSMSKTLSLDDLHSLKDSSDPDFANPVFYKEVEVWKNYGDTLGFYLSRGDGHKRKEGLYISRLVLGSYVERFGLLQVGDEILAINGIHIAGMPLENIVILIKYLQRIILTVKIN